MAEVILGAVLIAIALFFIVRSAKDQNGFVYVIYINKKGQTTRGWLNKKDLQPVE